MKIIAITEALSKHKSTIKPFNKKTIILKDNGFKTIQKYKNFPEIHIYDIIKPAPQTPTNKIIKINNHINKTGINILRENPQKTMKFYDITAIYEQNTKGKIAECFGNRSPERNKKTEYIQTGFLCNHIICAKYFKI